ncbi:MAG: tRNA(Ile)(2)-agmatinylcytidine synthase [Methanomassiliicoccales archaeon]
MAVYVGIDDTDGPEGMCTTYALSEILRRSSITTVFGYPRLVRLNPNIPWKTRGNGALAFAAGGPPDERHPAAVFGNKTVMLSKTADHVLNPREIFELAESVIEELAEFGEENTHPGLVVSEVPLPSSLYWSAVRGIVEKEEVTRQLEHSGALFKGWKKGRGIIGAAAAVAWPSLRKTYELITYRQREKWGHAREINEEDVMQLEQRFPSTFSNFDRINRHICIAPSSPCPVLYGIRSTLPDPLFQAAATVRSETKERLVLYQTNQATDDHIEKASGPLEPFHSYVLEGTISAHAMTIEGGHTFIRLNVNGSELICAAFEETKELRSLIRKLVPGDRVRVWGAFKPSKRGMELNIEKVQVVSLAPHIVKVSNPVCVNCGKRMKSAGKGAGYRCRECHTRSDAPVTFSVQRSIPSGLFGVAVASRRHLSTPPEKMAEVLEMVDNI